MKDVKKEFKYFFFHSRFGYVKIIKSINQISSSHTLLLEFKIFISRTFIQIK